jgi:hypothetical protein
MATSTQTATLLFNSILLLLQVVSRTGDKGLWPLMSAGQLAAATLQPTFSHSHDAQPSAVSCSTISMAASTSVR